MAPPGEIYPFPRRSLGRNWRKVTFSVQRRVAYLIPEWKRFGRIRQIRRVQLRQQKWVQWLRLLREVEISPVYVINPGLAQTRGIVQLKIPRSSPPQRQ